MHETLRFRLSVVTICIVACAPPWPSARAAEDSEKIGVAEPPADDEQDEDDEEDHGLVYRLIGPAAGGRVSRVAGVPGDPLTWYAATSAGGVWKSVNGGLDWESVFDDQPVSSIGSIAVAPSAPDVIYVGSGEANIRGNVGEGNGIYKSTDGGEHWSHVWEAEGQIGTMEVHPRDPDIAFAAVLGSPFGPGPERGVYRTTDGGDSWQKVLYVAPDTGASDVTFDPSNPSTLFAGLWQTRRLPWGMTSGGPGSGLYQSRDGGDSWRRLEGDGLPEGIWGKIGVRVAPSDSRRVYALIEAEEGGLFRSDDGGKTWELINDSGGLRQRAWYYTTLTIDPTDADVVWFPQVPMLKTIDGGEDIRSVPGGGWDFHDVWIDPENPERMIAGSDAGISLSRDGGETFVRPPVPISQFYHLSVDSSTPYRVMGSLQDWGTMAGPSNSLHEGGILLWDWHPVGGGEAGYVVADPSDPAVIWAGEYLGYLSRYDSRTGKSSHVGIYPDNGSGHGAGDLDYRFQWTAPIVISPHDPDVVYHAANVLFRTEDEGRTWRAISPDLTRDDESKQEWSGGPITGDNTSVEHYGTIFAVAESPLEAGVIWAGSDDGLVHVTRDGGETWDEVTPGRMPEWGTVVGIEASRFDAGTAYVVADAHRLDDETPYLWKTENYGRSWDSLTKELDPEIYLKVVREDTRRSNVLYLGTERKVMVSRDGGDGWETLQLNMPTVAIADMVVAGDDLLVGTLGRSAWILDDLAPVRQISPEIRESDVHLFAPSPTVRWHYTSAPNEYTAGAGDNPPEGALITYFLQEEPEDEITLEVLDAGGSVIRKLSSKMEEPYTTEDHPDWDPETELEAELEAVAGMNRAAWNLAHEGPKRIEDARSDVGDPGDGPKVLPGTYTLRLNVAGRSYEQPVEVRPDPRVKTDVEDLREQTDFNLDVRDRMSEIAAMVNTIRSLREQIESHNERLERRAAAEALVDTGEQAAAKLDTIENALHNPDATVDYDILAGRSGGAKLYSRYGWLFDGSLEHDGPPTQGMREVSADLDRELAEQRAALDELLREDVGRLNAMAAERNISYVIAPPAD
ncbi:MAG: WD40/YVTN/BNR-like repeat-containing protein [Gammaproteobacteria bacterium]